MATRVLRSNESVASTATTTTTAVQQQITKDNALTSRLGGADAGSARFATTEPNRLVVAARDHPARQVVVYSDRAEVTRLISGQELKFGQNEITIKGLSRYLERDSIRIEGIGDASIQDVSYTHHHAVISPPDADESTQEADQHPDRIRELQTTLEELRAEAERLREDRALQDGFMRQFTRSPGDACTSIPDVLQSGSIEAFQNFRRYYADINRELGRKMLENQREIEKTETLLERETAKAGSRGKKSGAVEEWTQITVIVDAEKNTLLDLRLSYVVMNASWTPRYDIRVEKDTQRLTLTYQAEIRQSTEEPWEDVQVVLSTAQPSLGGDAPELDIWRVYLQSAHMRRNRSNTRFGNAKSGSALPSQNYARGGALPRAPGDTLKLESSSTNTFFAEELNGKVAEFEVALTKESVSGMNYEIPARANIPSDNVTHRVTVAMLNMVPEFYYVAAPKVSTHIYLKAKVKNESEYALLSGPVNVFLDNSFVAKSTIKHVSPQESFECSLGVDPAVRVTYPPCSKREQAGRFTSRQQTQRFHQKIEIKNTRSSPITVRVSDQVPLSEEDRLQVRLIEPNIPIPSATTSKRGSEKDRPIDSDEVQLVVTGPRTPRMNDKNCLEWVLRLEPGRTEHLQFLYEIAFPIGDVVMHV